MGACIKTKSKSSPIPSATITPFKGSKVPVDLPPATEDVPVAEAEEAPLPEARAPKSLDEDATIKAPLENAGP